MFIVCVRTCTQVNLFSSTELSVVDVGWYVCTYVCHMTSGWLSTPHCNGCRLLVFTQTTSSSDFIQETQP